MSLELVSFQGLWPLLSRIPRVAGFFLSRYFKPTRMASLVYVDMYPRNESARIDLAQIASFQLQVLIINLSPFEIELDRANFDFCCGGVKLQPVVLKKERIRCGASTSLYLSGDIRNEQANQIARSQRGYQVSLSGNIEFNSSVCSFAKTVHSMGGVQLTIINSEARFRADS
jgi:hypothetical protein